MTPSEQDLYDRAEEFRDRLDEMDEYQGLNPMEERIRTFLCDLLDELESA